MLNNAVFNKHITNNQKVDMDIAIKIGRNKQSFCELINDLNYYGMPYVLQNPSSKWKEQHHINEFKALTKWNKRSNHDTRSAAYMGFLAIR